MTRHLHPKGTDIVDDRTLKALAEAVPAVRYGPLYCLALGAFAVGTESFMIAAILPKIAGDLDGPHRQRPSPHAASGDDGPVRPRQSRRRLGNGLLVALPRANPHRARLWAVYAQRQSTRRSPRAQGAAGTC